MAVTILSLLTLGACGGESEAPGDTKADEITVTGVVMAPAATNRVAQVAGDPCKAKDGFDDVKAGMQITLLADDNSTLALASLGKGKRRDKSGAGGSGGACLFEFKFPGAAVPSDFVSVDLGRRGEVKFSKDELNEPLSLSVGV